MIYVWARVGHSVYVCLSLWPPVCTGCVKINATTLKPYSLNNFLFENRVRNIILKPRSSSISLQNRVLISSTAIL